MADETPETDQTQQADALAQTAAEVTPDDEGAGEAVASAEPTAADPGPSSKVARAARDHAERSTRPSRTPEERDAERRARRAAKAVARRRRREQEKAKKASAPKGEGTPKAEPAPSSPQVRMGIVVSSTPDKTITVRIDMARRHRRYEKIVRSSRKLHVHDETNDAHPGDRVRVVECRPLSATKRWKLEEVLERAK